MRTKRPKLRNAPASLNRWTGNPHKDRREIARNTTNPGTPERRAAYNAAKEPS